MTEALPTIREELERKAIDFLESSMHLCVTGRMAQRDMALIGKTVWNITSGLVDSSVSDLASNAAEIAPTNSVKRNFIGNGNLITIAFSNDAPGFAMRTWNATDPSIKQVSKVNTEVGLREGAIARVVEKLKSTGYVEIN